MLQDVDNLSVLMIESSLSTEREMTMRNLKFIKIAHYLLMFHI